MPGTTGVDFLIEMQADARISAARTVLVTGQADQDDTIRAVNEAGLDHYIAKPWDARELTGVVKNELTAYVLERGIDPLPHLQVLDAVRAMDAIRQRH